MAKRRSVKKAARKPARKTAVRSKAPARRPAAAAAPAPPRIRAGIITHTELVSTDPPATRAWAEKVLDWKFGPTASTPTGPYHMWRFANQTGGGIRATNPSEPAGAVPYCEVPAIRPAFAKALAAGATEMLAPQEIPGGMGWIAVVTAPGGVAIGFWSTK